MLQARQWYPAVGVLGNRLTVAGGVVSWPIEHFGYVNFDQILVFIGIHGLELWIVIFSLVFQSDRRDLLDSVELFDPKRRKFVPLLLPEGSTGLQWRRAHGAAVTVDDTWFPNCYE